MFGLHNHAYYRHPKLEALQNFLLNFAGAAMFGLYVDSARGCFPTGFTLYTIVLGAAVYAGTMSGIIHGYNTNRASKLNKSQTKLA